MVDSGGIFGAIGAGASGGVDSGGSSGPQPGGTGILQPMQFGNAVSASSDAGSLGLTGQPTAHGLETGAQSGSLSQALSAGGVPASDAPAVSAGTDYWGSAEASSGSGIGGMSSFSGPDSTGWKKDIGNIGGVFTNPLTSGD